MITVFLGPYLTDVAKAAADSGGYVRPLGIPVRAGSYFAYTISASVLLSVLVIPLAAAVADRTGRKKPLLGAFACLGAAATAGLFFLSGDRYLLGGALLIVAYAASMVLFNAFLPQIAEPDERDAVSSRSEPGAVPGPRLIRGLRGDGGADLPGLGGAVVGSVHDRAAAAAARARQDGPGGAGPAPGLPVPQAAGGWAQPAATVRDMRRFPLTLAFLGAYLVHNDGVQTVISQASLYGSQELGLGQGTLIGAVLLVQVLAVAGALLLGRLAARYGARRTVLGSLVAWAVTIGAGYFAPAGEPLWFFALAAGIGLVLGGSQALSRSLFSHLVPAGKEAEYYSVYEVSDRGTSWLGPLLFGLTYQLTGDYRDAIISLLVFFAVGFALLARVPTRRAVAEAGNPVPGMI